MDYTKQQLIDALIAEYEYLCHDDYDPTIDPSTEEYRVELEQYEYDELIAETCTSEEFTLDQFMQTYS